MHIVVDRDTFKRAITVARAALPKRKPSVPVLTHLLLEAADGRLTLRGTDLTVNVRLHVETAVVSEDGAIAVSGRELATVVTSMPKGEITLTVETPANAVVRLRVTAGGASSVILGAPLADYPKFPDAPEGALEWVLPSRAFGEAVAMASYAAAEDATRPQLYGVNVAGVNGTTEIVGCDAFRMVRITLDGVVGDLEHLGIIMPLEAVDVIGRLCAVWPETATLSQSVDGQRVRLSAGNDVVAFTPVSGSYIGYDRAIGTALRGTTSAIVGTADFLTAARANLVVAKEANNYLLLSTPAAGTIGVSSKAATAGERSLTVPAIIEGEGPHAALDCEYLVDALRAIKQQQVLLTSTPGKVMPLALRGVGAFQVVHAIMPMGFHNEDVRQEPPATTEAA